MKTTAVPIAGAQPRAPAGLRDNLTTVSALIVDDDLGTRRFIASALRPNCKKVETAASTDEATRLIGEQHFDLVLLENVLPGQSGLDWLYQLRATGFDADVILVTAYADLDTVIHAMRAGASDFLIKPVRPNQLLAALSRLFERRGRLGQDRGQKVERNADILAARGHLLGKSAGIEAVRDTLERVARTNMPVLILGESGTGKEIAARTLHAMSDRADKPFIPVTCATISAERLCADLFGDAGDAAAGADGLLAQAAGGTIFFDQVIELPPRVQALLLRVIEDGRIRQNPAQPDVSRNIRFVFSCCGDLEKAVQEGTFRRDLYHRINAIEVTMPPLRDRVGDIPEFVALFMDKYARTFGGAPLTLSEEAMFSLASHTWPGNVRELRNLVERSIALGSFPPEFAGDSGDVASKAVESLQAVERQHILTVLEACGGNRAEAARRLGISRKTIDRKCAMWKVKSRPSAGRGK